MGQSYTFIAYSTNSNLSGAETAAGGQMQNMHIWGRNHIGWFDDSGSWSSNIEAEGAFVANVVLNAVNISLVGAAIYGTNGQSGQPYEVGLQLGYDNGIRTCNFDGVIYNVGNTSGGWPINATSRTSGNNKIKAVGTSPSNTTPFILNPYSSADYIEVLNYRGSSESQYSNPMPATFYNGLTSSGAFKASGTLATGVTTTASATYTLASAATVIYSSSASAEATWTLPSSSTGLRYTLINASAHSVTISGSVNINGTLSYTLGSNATVEIVCDGTNWWTF